jgi:hypothetical protein
MNEAATLRTALSELVVACRQEMVQCQNPEVLTRTADLENHLDEAEEAIKCLADAANSDECSVLARRALLAVARFRNALAANVLDAEQQPFPPGTSKRAATRTSKWAAG